MKEFKYIYIMEDGTFIKVPDFIEQDKKSCDEGVMSCIRVSDMKHYADGEWLDIPETY